MEFARYQSESTLFVLCSEKELPLLPKSHVTDMQTGEYLVEVPRTLPNLVALRLCGMQVQNYIKEDNNYDQNNRS